MTGVEIRHHSVPLPNATPPPLASVRALIAQLTDDLPGDLCDDLLLVASELVANAYEHGTAPRALRFARLDDTGHVVVEVDDGTPAEPVLGHSRLDGNRGRGLTIVAGIAERWGVRAMNVGKTVWARLRVVQPAG
jgi:anti-sigma regulatory factor (Ser/Thr protein kinase)